MTCTKRRLRDEVHAKFTLAAIRHKDSSRREKIETRAYECECGAWHLTFEPERNAA